MTYYRLQFGDISYVYPDCMFGETPAYATNSTININTLAYPNALKRLTEDENLTKDAAKFYMECYYQNIIVNVITHESEHLAVDRITRSLGGIAAVHSGAFEEFTTHAEKRATRYAKRKTSDRFGQLPSRAIVNLTAIEDNLAIEDN